MIITASITLSTCGGIQFYPGGGDFEFFSPASAKCKAIYLEHSRLQTLLSDENQKLIVFGCIAALSVMLDAAYCFRCSSSKDCIVGNAAKMCKNGLNRK